MKNLAKKTLVAFLAMALLISFIPVTQVDAASKKAVYVTQLSPNSGYSNLYTDDIQVNSKTIVITGTLQKGKSQDDAYVNGKLLESKERKYKLAKNCKYYTVGPEVDGDFPEVPMTKEEFKQLAESLNGLGLTIYVNKSGKVYKMVTSS